MSPRRASGLLLLAGCLLGCSQPFVFTDDSGPGDAGACLASGECECVGDLQCAGARSRCAADGLCVECLASSDCGPRGLCDSKTRRCTTACSVSSECTADTRDHCEGDAPSRHCVACEDSTLCPGGKRCAESVGFCVECVSDLHCDAGAPRCDRRTGTCVKCLAGSDCAPSEFCVVATGQCRTRL